MFQSFFEIYGTGERYASAGSEPRSASGVEFSEEYLQFVEQYGYCSYGDGVLWTTDPAQMAPVLRRWGPLVKDFAVFARTANGSLYLWNGDSVRVLHPHTASLVGVGPDIEMFFMSSAVDPRYRAKVLLEPIVKQLVAQLGNLRWDEMFAFVPALALGGTGAVESMKKANLAEHHAYLAQLEPLKVAR